METYANEMCVWMSKIIYESIFSPKAFQLVPLAVGVLRKWQQQPTKAPLVCFWGVGQTWWAMR